jgi:hypothetical protein
MVRRRLRSFVNVGLTLCLGYPMLLRVAAVVGALAVSAGFAYAEELTPEQARAFIVGKLFSYTCFDGTVGMGRIFVDGSVVGTIRPSGQGPIRFAALPAGTIKVSSTSVCAHLNGLMFEPCFRVQRTDARSFRGSLSALSFAYCDFTQHNPRTQLTSNDPMMREQEAAVAMPRPVAMPAPAARAPVTPVTTAPAKSIVTSSVAAVPVAAPSAAASPPAPAAPATMTPVVAEPVSTTLRPAIQE